MRVTAVVDRGDDWHTKVIGASRQAEAQGYAMLDRIRIAGEAQVLVSVASGLC